MNSQKRKQVDYWVGMLTLAPIKVLVVLLGKLLRRNHQLDRNINRICVMKLLGGGSLLIAYPSLLAIRRAYPHAKLTLVTLQATVPFGKSLGVFDEILAISDQSMIELVKTSISTIAKCFNSDIFIDLEVHSQLCTVFSALTASRNRIGFYTETVFWKKNLCTHLIFFNKFSGTYYFYDQVAHLLNAPQIDIAEARSHLLEHNSVSAFEAGETYRIGIGHSCSEMGRERMFPSELWVEVVERLISKKISSEIPSIELIFLGGPSDRESAEQIIRLCEGRFKSFSFRNQCGKTTVPEVIGILAQCHEFFGIDSSLIHYARLLNRPCTSFWGPTSPSSRLRPIQELHESIYYRKIPCSPCIHVTELPPCHGNNICMKRFFGDARSKTLSPDYSHLLEDFIITVEAG